MHEKFARFVEALHPKFEQLISMQPVKIRDLRSPLPRICVYLFSDGDCHLYVGRTRNFRQRMRQHSIDSASHNQAPFAFKLAREHTGNARASYLPEGSREALLRDESFAKAFLEAKRSIREMDLRYVEEDDDNRQALLEIYASVALDTPYNDFKTH